MRRLATSIILIIFLGSVISSVWGYRYLRTPVHHDKSSKFIEIERGSSTRDIIGRLTQEGVVKHDWPVLVYLTLSGRSSHLKAGEYRFSSPISPLAVIRKLEDGEQRLGRFAVIEGWTRWDIAMSMARIPELKLQGSDTALELMDNTSMIRDLDPKADNLEGYLFPDTYSFSADTQAPAMIATMVKRFRQEWKPEWTIRAATMNLTPREVVIVASLVETEAKLNDERPLVASVVYNRLKNNMTLGIDSTVIYASKLSGKWKNDGHVYKSDLERQSPYNTRLQPGLPPGPIASPGSHSLMAALFPANTNFLYYVRDPQRNDGTHNFYSNKTDFDRGVQALRDWEQRRANDGKSSDNSPAGDADTQ